MDLSEMVRRAFAHDDSVIAIRIPQNISMIMYAYPNNDCARVRKLLKFAQMPH
jgi:hypothetical protein